MTVTALHPHTLGGSEIPAVLGLDPYVSAYALACRKLGVSGESTTSPAARMGNRLQAVHAELVADDGYTVMPAPADGIAHPDLPWLVGHPDAFVVLTAPVVQRGAEHQAPKAPVKGTVTGAASTERAPLELKLRGLAPSEPMRMRDTVQALVYAELCDSSQAMVSELHGGYGGIVRDEWTVERDGELFAVIVERCEGFLSLIRRGKCPAPDGSESARDALRARYGGLPETRVRLSRVGWEHLQRVRELDETISAAKVQRERYAQLVQDEIGDAVEAITPFDTLAARWAPVSSNRVDVKALRDALPEIANRVEALTRATGPHAA